MIYEQLKDAFNNAEDKMKFIYDLREFIHKELSPVNTQPIDLVR